MEEKVTHIENGDKQSTPHAQKITARQWFSELDSFTEEQFMADGRDQPTAPERNIFD